MSATPELEQLREALREAVTVANACKAFVDEQAGRYFNGERPNWRKAATACFDEIDGKPEEWAALLETNQPA